VHKETEILSTLIWTTVCNSKGGNIPRSPVIGRMKRVPSHRVRKLVGILVAIQAIQISNLLPLLLDPRPEFFLGLVMNLTAGVLAGPVAYITWSGRKYSRLIALPFAVFAFCSAAYLQHLVVARSREAFLPLPLTISLIMMVINVAIVIPLLFFSGQRLLR